MRLRPNPHDEAGFSLIELLVSLAILSAVLAAVTTSAIAIQRASAQVENKTGDQGHARTAIAAFSRDIRVATSIPSSSTPALLVARPRELQFTSALGSFDRPSLVSLSVDGSQQLIESATPPDPASTPPALVYNAADEVTRFVARFVTDPSQAFFRYYDENDVELVPSGSPAELTEVQRRNVRRIDIEITVQEDLSGRARQTTVRTSVRLPNPVG